MRRNKLSHAKKDEKKTRTIENRLLAKEFYIFANLSKLGFEFRGSKWEKDNAKFLIVHISKLEIIVVDGIIGIIRIF